MGRFMNPYFIKRRKYNDKYRHQVYISGSVTSWGLDIAIQCAFEKKSDAEMLRDILNTAFNFGTFYGIKENKESTDLANKEAKEQSLAREALYWSEPAKAERAARAEREQAN